MRVAVVHDWLYVIGGAERVLHEILKCFPDADVFTLFDALSDKDRNWIGIRSLKTSFLQNMPFIKTKHRHYLPLMPFAIEQFDLSSYDLVISSSYAVAKGVITGPDQIHVSYTHSPMRYAWDLQHSYLRESGFNRGIAGALVRVILHAIRIWDTRTAHGPDVIIANSHFVARRIRKIYGRHARVIHPPVTLARCRETPKKGRHFLVASRLVAYKNVDAVIDAFAAMPDLELIVAGDGPERERLRAKAPSNVTFVGFVSDDHLRDLMASARAFVFAAEEDFGIVTVEAQAEGTPVLVLGRGGSRETVVTEGPHCTGMFFERPEPALIANCVREFTRIEHSLSSQACRQQAESFSAESFRRKLLRVIDLQVESHDRKIAGSTQVLAIPEVV